MISYNTPDLSFLSLQAHFTGLPQAPVAVPSGDDVSPVPPPAQFRLWKGADDVCHDWHDFAPAPVQLTPTITTFYGHELLTPYGITLTPVSSGRKVRVVRLTLHRADRDPLRELTVTAWQGDNDTLHLLAPLPDEDELLGPVKRTVFGVRRRDEERRDWMLGKLYYGDTAILDVDVSQFVTPGRALRA